MAIAVGFRTERAGWPLWLVAISLTVSATIVEAGDHAAMAGSWRVLSLDIDGNRVADDDARKLVVVNEPDGSWTLQVDGQTVSTGTSTVHEDADPRRIELAIAASADGRSDGRVFEGIYELGEKTRRVCFAMPERTRPTQFSSAAGSGHVLVIYERIE